MEHQTNGKINQTNETIHLTDEQIIEFVTDRGLDEETLRKAGIVTAHIVRCDECLRRVKAFQLLSDEFERLRTVRASGKTVADVAVERQVDSVVKNTVRQKK